MHDFQAAEGTILTSSATPSRKLPAPRKAQAKADITKTHHFYEFFAGGGMARAGLGPKWTCSFANDFDDMKADVYRANWGDDHLAVVDVAKLTPDELPGHADLVWGSFPCQDLSLAGDYAGLNGARSGTFHPFWMLMKGLIADQRAPKLIVLENVYGAITSRGGRDFTTICSKLSAAGYSVGAAVMDARLFVPQSRPRLFIIGVRKDVEIPTSLVAEGPSSVWHPAALVSAQAILSKTTARNWVWWNLPTPAKREEVFADLIEANPVGVKWHTREETAYLLSLMSKRNAEKVQAAQAQGRRIVGGVYRRTRTDEHGVKRQRAEVRFDDIAGCLRTPAGGSSRQTILVIDGKKIKSRLLSPREAARLMGLPDTYKLPARYNDAYHLAGDGVVVPVVRHLSACLLEPILAADAAAANLDEAA